MISTNEEEKGRVPAAMDREQQERLLESSREAVRALNPPIITANCKTGKLTGQLAFAVFAVTLSSFQFGYHIGCINAPQKLIEKFIGASHKKMFGSTLGTDGFVSITMAWATAVSIFAVGGMIGGLLSGAAADRFGRKGALMLNNIIAFIAAVLMTMSKYVEAYPMIIVGRLLIGINCGLSSGLVPMYLTEVSPVNLRGMIGSIHQLLVTIAILVSQVLGLSFIFGSEARWPYIFAFTVVPSAFQLLTLPACVESPKYTLIVKGQDTQAERDLKRLRGTDEVDAEIADMKEESYAAANQEKVTIADMFGPALRKPLIIAVMMMLSQQLSGINVAMFYSNSVFMNAGLDQATANYATIGMGAVNVLMTVIAVWLVDHPKFGRRSLHLTGLTGMLFSALLIFASLRLYNSGVVRNVPGSEYGWAAYGSIVFIITFVISFATGPGAIPWFFVSELFHSNERGTANSIAVAVNWTANLFVALSFPILHAWINEYSFLLFCAFLVFFIYYTFKFVPETKGKTVDEVLAVVNGDSASRPEDVEMESK
ncbi:hypothetical protein PFISCL1PPCAC_5449 [Pristionchus fissidentatus]|uniref:Major facilitator superfamily (MFS) profile domain-containing protein n=1 Tax=Pristionchus fissidentatus TaxID=1538716 RepID=A0AAV5V3I0_9BILA|nr:hypothetical protein PFISCL1PPCAC_5449 [Pristionchus fissidentatus]